jgi:hypothetical protein
MRKELVGFYHHCLCRKCLLGGRGLAWADWALWVLLTAVDHGVAVATYYS